MKELKSLKEKVYHTMMSPIKQNQKVAMFFDNFVFQIIKDHASWKLSDKKTTDVLKEIDHLHQCANKNRFTPWEDRVLEEDINILTTIIPFEMTQGTHTPIKWKGHNVFKSCHDIMLYLQLLSEIKPKTIIEFGTGSGGSALLLADIHRDCIIKTYDILDCKFNNKNIEFEKIDLTESFPDLKNLVGPIVVIEDAHVNVTNVLLKTDEVLSSGDYLIIEDSFPKHESIAMFLRHAKNKYVVDTYYTDFFGRNSTSAKNSILKVI